MPDGIPRVRITQRSMANSTRVRSNRERFLVQFLREELNLTGTHIGCDTSYCGACTVLLNGKSVKSCTVFAFQADGGEVLTVEGLAQSDGLHPRAAGLQRLPWFSVRILHARIPDEHDPVAAGTSPSHRVGHSQSHRRKHLPLYRIPEHLQGD